MVSSEEPKKFEVHLGTLKAQKENYRKYREEILKSGHRFAVVHTELIEFYNQKEILYKTYPSLNPNSKLSFGTSPLLIDIGKETNSLEYRKEKFGETKEKYKNDLIKQIKEWDELKKIGKQLILEEKANKKKSKLEKKL